MSKTKQSLISRKKPNRWVRDQDYAYARPNGRDAPAERNWLWTPVAVGRLVRSEIFALSDFDYVGDKFRSGEELPPSFVAEKKNVIIVEAVKIQLVTANRPSVNQARLVIWE